jgi:hypothetical protein
MKHRHPHRHQEVDDLPIVRQAAMKRGRAGGKDGRKAAEFIEQLVDDRAGVG